MPTSTQPLLQIEEISKSFGPQMALTSVSFSVHPGEIVALVGPNGAGKSTTVACATGLLEADSGSICVLGHEPTRASAEVRSRVGVMLQDGGLTSGANARQLLRYASKLYAHPRDSRELAELLQITDFDTTLVRRLSGGQRQRLSLALALLGTPDLLFLDEATAGMDAAARRTTRELIKSEAQRGAGVVLTTHNLDEVDSLADRIVVIAHGRVLADGSPADVVRTLSTATGQALTFDATTHSAEALDRFTAEVRDVAARHGVEITTAPLARSLEDILVTLGSSDTSADDDGQATHHDSDKDEVSK